MGNPSFSLSILTFFIATLKFCPFSSCPRASHTYSSHVGRGRESRSVAPAVGERAQAAADRGRGAGMLHEGGGSGSGGSSSRCMAPGRTAPRQSGAGGCTRRHCETRGAAPSAWRCPRARCAAIRWVRLRRCCRLRGAPSRPLPLGCSRGTASSPLR
jgi:hypothetical protein